jgi:hypothetical protein
MVYGEERKNFSFNNSHSEDLNISEIFLKYQVKFEPPPAGSGGIYKWL